MASSPTGAARKAGKATKGGTSESAASDAEAQAAEAEALAAEAEAEAAEAEAQAAQARARAAALRAEREQEARRRAAEAAAAAEAADTEDVDADYPEAEQDEDTAGRSWLRVPKLSTVAASLVVLVIAGLLAASGYMVWQSHQTAKHWDQEAAFTTAARQGVVNLMSLNFNHGDQDMQRLIDSTTGQFREDFEKSKTDFLAVMKGSRVITQAEVRAIGVESMTDDSAVVLVAANSQVSNSASSTQAPRAWRLSVTIERDNGQLKMAKVEFVP